MQAVVGRQEAERRKSAFLFKKQDASGLSMYSEPPEEDISLEDFEAFALDRLAGKQLKAETRPRLATVAVNMCFHAVLKSTEDSLGRGIRGEKLDVRSPF